MNKIKLALLDFFLLILVTIEFFLGFIVAVCDHFSDGVTAIQTLKANAVKPPVK
jgi:hypothetical protein